MTLLYHARTPGDVDELVKAGNRLLFYTGKNEFVSRR